MEQNRSSSKRIGNRSRNRPAFATLRDCKPLEVSPRAILELMNAAFPPGRADGVE
ncbi:MAG: hypothetical protein HC933_22555 [Pleurocapsa sp. SU_196_0]|nr:hypothetical protein [Pleurocapsa sp. SU_196_0]